MGTLTVICVLSLIVVSVSSLPIVVNSNYETANVLPNIIVEEVATEENKHFVKVESVEGTVTLDTDIVSEVIPKKSNITLRNNVRPGMLVNTYDVTIVPNLASRTYTGSVLASITITDTSTREDELIFHAVDLSINSVQYAVGGSSLFVNADFDMDDDDGILEISAAEATTYSLLIQYQGVMGTASDGMFSASDGSYIGMNLHPTNARRVFPCIDEPTEPTTIRFTFEDVPFSNIIVNSLLEDGSDTRFKALNGPPHIWGMIAHNFIQIASPTNQLRVFARQGLRNQDNLVSVAILDYFREMEEYTGMPYFEIIDNQHSELSIVALADTNVDWYALSTIGIWEPHILLETDHPMAQRKTALVKLAEAISRQWFGHVIYPENFRHQWIISGLASYSAYELAKNFQTNTFAVDITLIDMNTMFLTDVLQESLYRDGYTSGTPLLLPEDIFDEEDIRDHVNGIQKYKAPAVMRMLRFILGREEDDFIKIASGSLLQSRKLQTVSTFNFYDSVNGYWTHQDYQLIGDLEEFMEPWVENNGYPLIEVGLRQGGVRITQEHFGFSATSQVNYMIPLTFTTSINANYEEENTFNIMMMDQAININMILSEGDEDNDIPADYVIFNIQGHGYYRVTYDDILWDRIIDALNDPDRRQEIHPLNRATLVDDALNLARANKLDYNIAFQVVLSMEHETDYAVWKAFDRNMKFLQKRLEAYVFDDEDLDPDIYLRMVRRTVGLVEEELTFYPDPNLQESAMDTLTRSLVMDHACRAGYQPCIAAAVDWFYDPDSSEQRVNPNIPRDIRPAVYCAMVREGDAQVLNALYELLESEIDAYERVVILQSFACSEDENFINSLLLDTITQNSGIGIEERSKIFQAVAESSYTNIGIAINFMAMRTIEIRDMYGGPRKLEEMIYILAENIADDDQTFDFTIWVNSMNNNIEDSQDVAERALAMVIENLQWNNNLLEDVYEWIDDNDAPTLMVSIFLLSVSIIVALFNY